MKRLFAVLLFTLATAANAVVVVPVDVKSSVDKDDTVGSNLVYQIKEDIRKSASLDLSLDDSTSQLQAVVVTLNPNADTQGLSTAYSVVINLQVKGQPFPFYLQQFTGYCGQTKIDYCARSIVSEISNLADTIVRAFIKYQNDANK